MARTGRYKIILVAGVLVIASVMIWLTTLTGSTPLWVIGAMLFGLGAGLGLIMQNVVLAAQNAVSPDIVGTATSPTTTSGRSAPRWVWRSSARSSPAGWRTT